MDSSPVSDDSVSWDEPPIDVDAQSWTTNDSDKKYIVKTKCLRMVAQAIREIAEDESPVAISSEGSMNNEDLNVSVTGMGQLTFPVGLETIKNLKKICGKATEDAEKNNLTLVSSELVQVEFKKIDKVMENVKSTLKVEKDCPLILQLRDLVVIESGQCDELNQVTKSQFSGKSDTLAAVLIISLPSPHIGGGHTICHFNCSTIFTTETLKANQIKYVTFFAECEHSIEQLKEGNKVFLIYNVLIESKKPKYPVYINVKLLESVETFFKKTIAFPGDVIQLTEKVDNNSKNNDNAKKSDSTHNPDQEVDNFASDSSYSTISDNDEDKEIEKLVYLLDHTYRKTGKTQGQSLNWEKLKHSDKKVAYALLAVAEELELCSYLSVAAMSEIWKGAMYNSSDYDDDFEMFETVRGELINLKCFKEDSFKFSSIEVYSDEICWTRGNTGFDIQERFHHQGGPEVRYYNRAAITLYPKALNTKIIYKFNHDAAVEQLKKLIETPGNQETIKSIRKETKEYFYGENAKNVDTFVKVALYINDAKEALFIALQFIRQILSVKNIDYFLQLQAAYGKDWCLKLLNRKEFIDAYYDDKLKLAAHFRTKQLDDDFVEAILMCEFKSVFEREMASGLFFGVTDWKKNYLTKIESLLIASIKLGMDKVKDKIVTSLMEAYYNIKDLAVFYLEVVKKVDKSKQFNLDSLKKYVIDASSKEVEKFDKNPKQEGDWSIEYNVQCLLNCDDCRKIEIFMTSSTQRLVTFPVNKERFKHIKTILNSLNLPISITTLKPLKIKITKSSDVYLKPQKFNADLKQLLQELQEFDSKLQEMEVEQDVIQQKPTEINQENNKDTFDVRGDTPSSSTKMIVDETDEKEENCIEMKSTASSDMDSSVEDEERNTQISYDDAETWDSDEFEKPYIVRTKSLRKVTSTLTNILNEASKTAFFAQGTLNHNDIQVCVADVGDLQFPITTECAEALKKLALLAKYGLGEKTLLNTNVRNTYMIPSARLDVNIKGMDELMQQLRSSLHLDPSGTLEPHLYNMLIYEQGQFFNFHQDSEKLENMVATLVVSLPSPHVGGDLIIEHLNHSTKVSTENIKADHLDYVAFYADCRHKVTVVKEGYRIVLTFNLVLKTNESTTLNPRLNMELLNAIKSYFYMNLDNDSVDTWSNEEKVEKLVYLLDHRYTKNGLKWNMLKGNDAKTLVHMVQIAKKLDSELYLALADVNETWNGYADDNEYGPTEFENFGNFKTELSYLTSYFTDSNMFGKISAGSHEVCWTTDNKMRPPYSKTQDYTGNEGSSEERWYRRAALILVPRSCLSYMRMRYHYEQVTHQLQDLMRTPGNEASVEKVLKKTIKFFLSPNSANKISSEDVGIFTKASVYVKNEDLALTISTNYFEKLLKPESLHLLSELKLTYSQPFLLKLLKMTNIASITFMENIVDLIKDLTKKEFGREFCEKIINRQIKVLERNTIFCEPMNMKLRYSPMIIKMCIWLGFDAGIKRVTNILKHKPYKVQNMAEVYLNCIKTDENIFLTEVQLSVLNEMKNYIVQAIKNKINAFEKKVNSKCWSINKNNYKCSCGHCEKVIQFLKSPKLRTAVFLFDKETCKHIKQSVCEEAPVVIKPMSKKKPTGVNITKKMSVIRAASRVLTKLRRLLADVESASSKCNTFETEVEPCHAPASPRKIV